MENKMQRLPIPELEKLDDSEELDVKRKIAYFMLNDADHALQMYGDTVDLTGEGIVERHDRARRRVNELTRIGIQAGYLTKDLIEV
ncbi:MAG: hypothetical protein ABI716_01050 [Candidatus Saccharibacteria bacterium]